MKIKQAIAVYKRSHVYRYPYSPKLVLLRIFS